MTVKAPKKMIKVNGIMKLNPEYTRWKESQDAGGGVKPSAPPEAQMAATDATGVPLVAATFVDESNATATTGASSGYSAPGVVQTNYQQNEPMSTVPAAAAAAGGGGYPSPANYAPHQPPHQHHPPPHHPHPPPPGQRPPQYRGKFGTRPVDLVCPHCHRQMRTRTDEVIGMGTIIAIFILLFFFWPLFWLPLVIPDCKQTDHYCRLCNAKVGEKPSSCCSDGCC